MHYNSNFYNYEITENVVSATHTHTLSVLRFEHNTPQSILWISCSGFLLVFHSKRSYFPFSSLLSILSIYTDIFWNGMDACKELIFVFLHFPFEREFQTKSHFGESNIGWDRGKIIYMGYTSRLRKLKRNNGGWYAKNKRELQNIREHFEIIKRKLEQNFKLNMEIFAEFSHVVMFVKILFWNPFLPGICYNINHSLVVSEIFSICLHFFRPTQCVCLSWIVCLWMSELVSEWASKKFSTSTLHECFCICSTFAWLFYRILFHLEFVYVNLYHPHVCECVCLCVYTFAVVLFFLPPHLSYSTFRITTVTKSR